jgi:hypothetical protein
MKQSGQNVTKVRSEAFHHLPPTLRIFGMNQSLLPEVLQNFRHLFQAAIHLKKLVVKDGLHKNELTAAYPEKIPLQQPVV